MLPTVEQCMTMVQEWEEAITSILGIAEPFHTTTPVPKELYSPSHTLSFVNSSQQEEVLRGAHALNHYWATNTIRPDELALALDKTPTDLGKGALLHRLLAFPRHMLDDVPYGSELQFLLSELSTEHDRPFNLPTFLATDDTPLQKILLDDSIPDQDVLGFAMEWNGAYSENALNEVLNRILVAKLGSISCAILYFCLFCFNGSLPIGRPIEVLDQDGWRHVDLPYVHAQMTMLRKKRGRSGSVENPVQSNDQDI